VLAVSMIPFLNLITIPVVVMAATLLVVEAGGPPPKASAVAPAPRSN